MLLAGKAMLAEAKAVIRSLSGKLTGVKHELRLEQPRASGKTRALPRLVTRFKPPTGARTARHRGACLFLKTVRGSAVGTLARALC